MVMNILRAEHSAEYPFVMMSKKTANDEGLSLAARGLLAWLLDKPDSWNIDPDAIARLNKTTLYEVKKLLNELTREKYLVPPQRQHVKGRWQYTPYMLRETPNIAVDVEIEIPENSDAKTDALLQDDCNSITVSDDQSRTGVKHETPGVQITKTNNNNKTGTETETKTELEPPANSETPALDPAVLSVSENPEQNPINNLDIRAMILPDTPLLPATVPEPPASIFVLEETPSKHELPATLQHIDDAISSTPHPVPSYPLPEPEPEIFENFLVDEFEQELDREIPGLKPGDPPLYKPTPGWNRITAAWDEVVGGTIGGTLLDLLNDGMKLRGVDAVVKLILSSKIAEKRSGFVFRALENWQEDALKKRSSPRPQKPVDDGIIWSDDGSLGGYT